LIAPFPAGIRGVVIAPELRNNIRMALMVSKQTFVDFVLEDLRYRRQYLLAVKVHARFSESHHSSDAEMQWYYRKDQGKIVEIDRGEFGRLAEGASDRKFGEAFVLYSFAYRSRTILDLVVAERWGRRSQAIRFEVRIARERLKALDHSVHLLWRRDG
jgi:hypothetical protein